jgi:hypothetical protein
MQRTADLSANDCPTAVALLRAIYDMVDRLKAWETDRGLDGAVMFQTVRNKLAPAIERREFRTGSKDLDGQASSPPRDVGTGDPADERAEMSGFRTAQGDERYMELQAMLVQLRAAEAHLRERTEAERKTAHALADARNELDTAIATLAQTRGDLNETRSVLDQTRTNLTKVGQEAEQLSNSARLFTRQYLPKLRRHLLRWRT